MAIREGEPIIVPFYDSTYLNVFERRFLEDGMGILNAAGVPQALQVIAGEMQPKYPDVGVESPFVVISRGIVGMKMTWDSKEEVATGVRVRSNAYLMVAARVTTHEIVVSTSDGWQVLPEVDWHDRNILIQAITVGRDNPLNERKILGGVR